MKVSDVWSSVQLAGFVGSDGKPQKSDADLKEQLTNWANGKFNLGDTIKMAIAGAKPTDVQGFSQNMMTIVNKDFSGSPTAALGFLQKVQGTSIGQLDYNQMVSDGEADKLVQLDRTNPAGFAKVISGHYGSLQALDSALAPSAAPATPAVPVAAVKPATAPALRRPGM